jgi:hypothetical protein
MNLSERWHRHAVLAFVLVATMLAPVAQFGRVAGAQEATPVGAQPCCGSRIRLLNYDFSHSRVRDL